MFGGNGFAGRFDDIKLYNKGLRPWEITANYWGTEYSVDPKNKLSITWGEVKHNAKPRSDRGSSEKNIREWKEIGTVKKRGQKIKRNLKRNPRIRIFRLVIHFLGG